MSTPSNVDFSCGKLVSVSVSNTTASHATSQLQITFHRVSSPFRIPQTNNGIPPLSHFFSLPCHPLSHPIRHAAQIVKPILFSLIRMTSDFCPLNGMEGHPFPDRVENLIYFIVNALLDSTKH
ncbi:hypothetical protein TNCT_629261 [Trichonephila clavata]|uniref:Uncharacterized protein n=1 Tax=Trichonephila clavata TaxID=2740835 RepID=A0A8X6JB59_TRICU|nr:hypothetical protein TNCT_629261 [Trichonephila clavata]